MAEKNVSNLREFSPEDGSEVTDSEPALEAVRDVYGEFAEKLLPTGLLEHLYSNSYKVLTRLEYETAKSKATNYEQNTEVLSALMKRSRSDVLKFCQLLFTQKQHNCGKILLAALRKWGVDVSSITVPSPNPPVIKNCSPRYYPEMTDLQDVFDALVRRVNGAGRSLEDFKIICVQLLNKMKFTHRNVQEDIDKLMECSSGDYILYLQPYWDPLDCDLLLSLIQQMNNPKLTGDWEVYRSKVGEACRGTLADCKRNLPQGRGLPTNRVSIGFQTDQPPHDVMVQKIVDLQDFLRKMVGFGETDFEGFANSDVTLFYTVGRIRLPFLVRLCALHRRSLQEFSITVVFVPGEFIYDVATDQEFPYSEITSDSGQLLQVKDLKTEMLQQFEELKKSRASSEDLRDEVISLKLKLQEEKMAKERAQASSEDLRDEVMSLTLKLREEKMAKKCVEEDERRRAKEFLVLHKENAKLALKNDLLNEKLISVQESFMTKKESALSSISSKEMKSEIQSLLELQPSSIEGLQDKLKLLLEEWSKEEESLKQGVPVVGEDSRELNKAMVNRLEAFMSTMMEKLDDLVKRLGCEGQTLTKELRDMFSCELRPLYGSFQTMYNHLRKKKAVELCQELFDENHDRVLRSDKMSMSSLCSIKMPDLPFPIANATNVIIRRNLYLAGGAASSDEHSQIIPVYNIDRGNWTSLPPAPQFWCEAIAINRNLVLIGGKEPSTAKITNRISTWLVDEERWSQTIPPMSMGRCRPGVVLLGKFLFVFGGMGEDEETLLDSYEVLDVETNQWSSGHGLLPRPLYGQRLGVFKDAVILTSAWFKRTKPTNKSWKVPVRVLKEGVTNSLSEPIQWTPVDKTPCTKPSLLTNSRQPVTVGGFTGDQSTKDIYRYTSDGWELVGQLSEPRISATVVTISNNSFLVLGGCTRPADPFASQLNSVELILLVS